MTPEIEVAVTVRVPSQALERVDAAVRKRVSKIPRHSWLLEAIYEKLEKEERVEGDLEVVRDRTEGQELPERYRLRFFRADRQKRTPVAPLDIVGRDYLERYLVQWGLPPNNARGWTEKLRLDDHVLIPNMMLPADRAGRYGFRVAGLGIHAKLPDGRTAFLFHNHPRNAPDDVRGDRIKIFSASGGREREVTVTEDGRVLVLVESHIWPPEAPGTVITKFRLASDKEAIEFLEVYRLYVPD